MSTASPLLRINNDDDNNNNINTFNKDVSTRYIRDARAARYNNNNKNNDFVAKRKINFFKRGCIARTQRDRRYIIILYCCTYTTRINGERKYLPTRGTRMTVTV